MSAKNLLAGEDCSSKTEHFGLRQQVFTDTFRVLTKNSDADAAQHFFALFKEKADRVMTDSTKLFPDTIPVLTRLRESGVKTGIITSKFHYRIDAVLQKFAVTHLVDCIVGLEDVKNAKPSPEGLLKAIRELQAEKARVLFVGDSLIDAETAANAAVDFAAVTTGTTEAAAFVHDSCVVIAEDLTRLFEP